MAPRLVFVAHAALDAAKLSPPDNVCDVTKRRYGRCSKLRMKVLLDSDRISHRSQCLVQLADRLESRPGRGIENSRRDSNDLALGVQYESWREMITGRLRLRFLNTKTIFSKRAKAGEWDGEMSLWSRAVQEVLFGRRVVLPKRGGANLLQAPYHCLTDLAIAPMVQTLWRSF